jgi:hypothetical protein
MTPKKNIAHSIFQRILNQAKERNEDFNLLLTRYGMERFLYRLSISTYSDHFTLKGASLFFVWMNKNYRVTRDADLLASEFSDLSGIIKIFKEICEIKIPHKEGVIYLSKSVNAIEIREGQR